MAGRPPSKNRKSTSYTILFPDQDFIDTLDIIAKREGISRKALILRFCEEGMVKHKPGNPQTLIETFAEGAERTYQIIEGSVRQVFRLRGSASKMEILSHLRHDGVDGKSRVEMCNRIMAWLRENGVEVTW